MSRVIPVSREQLETRRDVILRRLDLSLEELRTRAESGSLLGEEWEDWQTICDIAFLLGDD